MLETRQKEATYFSEHAAYSSIASTMGTAYLVSKCSELLLQNIYQELPKIKTKLTKLINDKEIELLKFPYISKETNRGHYQQITRDFQTNFNGMLDGSFYGNSLDNSYELQGGAKIASLFGKNFEKSIEKNASHEIFDKISDITIMVQNLQGVSGGLFLPNHVFHTIVIKMVNELEAPCLELAQKTLAEMHLIQYESIDQISLLNTFPHVKTDLKNKIDNILENQYKECLKNLKILIKLHKSRISYETFNEMKDMDKFRSKDIDDLIGIASEYFKLVKYQIIDMAPKYVQLLLIDESKELVQALIDSITDDQLNTLMVPPLDIQTKRHTIQTVLDKLRDAQELLSSVRL
mmetsp:Transcript_1301/g.1649  ORF Transcript_1301/g.1649 Transcript_1301/m.1649 type:complete len:349 (+) Transcript_1301:576-1622(+)